MVRMMNDGRNNAFDSWSRYEQLSSVSTSFSVYTTEWIYVSRCENFPSAEPPQKPIRTINQSQEMSWKCLKMNTQRAHTPTTFQIESNRRFSYCFQIHGETNMFPVHDNKDDSIEYNSTNPNQKYIEFIDFWFETISLRFRYGSTERSRNNNIDVYSTTNIKFDYFPRNNTHPSHSVLLRVFLQIDLYFILNNFSLRWSGTLARMHCTWWRMRASERVRACMSESAGLFG